MVLFGKGCQEWAVLEDEHAELAQVHTWEHRALGAEEILIEPMCFLYLKSYSCHGRKVFLWEVDDKAHAKIVQPYEKQQLEAIWSDDDLERGDIAYSPPAAFVSRSSRPL